MSIVSGSVTIEDGTKAKEEYAPARKVAVTINFAVPEGAVGQPFLDLAARAADNKVREMLGRPTVAPDVMRAAHEMLTTTAPKTALQVVEAVSAKTEKPAAKPKAEKPAGKTKADLAKEAGLPTTDTVHKAPAEALDALDETPAPVAPVSIGDELESLGIDAAPAITDKELGDAANKKAIELRAKHGDKYDPTILRALLTSYYGTGTRIASIPTDKRPEFMETLAALK
jgi:hypothetical protein